MCKISRGEILTPAPSQYQLHANGSLTMSPAPFADDGRLQTQNPCTPTTSILTYYNEWEMWDKWEINIDTNHQAYSIRAQNYNGKVPRCARGYSPGSLLLKEWLRFCCLHAGCS